MKKDETLMSICAETQGCIELDPDSGEPNGIASLQDYVKQGALVRLRLVPMEKMPIL